MKKPSEKMMIINSAILISIVQFVSQFVMGVVVFIFIRITEIVEINAFTSGPVILFVGWLLSIPAIIGAALLADKLNKKRMAKYENFITK